MRYLLLFFLLLVLTAPAWAQARSRPAPEPGTISGIITDSATGQPLREASVALLNGRDSSYVTFTITDGDGRFRLRRVAFGSYQLLFTFPGHESRRHAVRLTPDLPATDLGNLRMAPLMQTLGEVVIQQERAPVSISGDTLAFSAKAFRTQPNAPVEALLRKLPGVEVDRDGNIRAQGQAVNRVLVDGKPFFGDDPRVATRNLPADIVDQVQVFDQQSDQAALSGIDDGNRQRTMNLVTRRDKRKGYFGQNTAGGGTHDRYRGQLGLNRFNNGRQLSLLGMANNVNQAGFGDNGGLPGPDGLNLGAGGLPGNGFLNGGPGGGGPFAGGGGRIVIGGGGRRGESGEQPSSITETGALGLNYRDAWGKRAEVAASYLASRTTVTTDQQRHRQQVVPATPGDELPAALVTDEHAFDRSRATGHRLNLRLDYTLDSLTSLRLTPGLAWQAGAQHHLTGQQSQVNGRLLNQGQTRYDATTGALAGVGSALLMRRFAREGRTASANLTTTLNNQDGETFNRADNTLLVPDTLAGRRALNQRIGSAAGIISHVVTLAYTEPLSLTRKLQLQAGLTDSRARGDRRVDDFEPGTGQYSAANELLSNRFTSAYTARRVGLALQTRRLRYGWTVGLDAQQADLQVSNLSADSLVSRRFTNLLPNATFTWNGPRGRTLRVNYRARLSPPAPAQLQPVRDVTNPLNVQAGNPALLPERTQQLTASYNHFNMTTNRSVFGLLTASRTQDRITSATTISPAGAQLTRPVNADGYRALMGYFSLGQRLASPRLNVNATGTGNVSRALSFVNGATNEARSWQIGPGASLNSAFNEKLEVTLRGSFTRQAVRYSLLPARNESFWTSTLMADAYLRLPGHLVLTTDLWYTANTGRAAGFNRRVALWNAGMAWQLLRNQQGEVRLQVLDLLNQNRGIQRNVTDTYIEDVRSRVLTRYWLVSFSYNLRHFGV